MIVCSWAKPVGDGLKEVILETGDKQNRKTIVIGDMTDWNMRHHTCFDNIAKFVETKVGGEVYDIWGAVYNKGDYAGKHSHEGVKNVSSISLMCVRTVFHCLLMVLKLYQRTVRWLSLEKKNIIP